MTTITTKQLRDNMAEVVSSLRNGKTLQLSYRQKVVATLQPIAPPNQALRRGSPGAVQQFLNTTEFDPVSKELQMSPKSFKQQLTALRDDDLLR